MVAMAHPDDIEFTCAGTVAKWADEGQHIVYVLATSGDKGSDDPKWTSESLSATREAEQRAAAEVLDVKAVEFLRYKDAELVADMELRKDVTRMIRKHKPDAIVCQDPTARYFNNYIQHPDHIAMGEAVLAAVFPSARDRLTFPDLLLEEGYEPHKCPDVYLVASREQVDHFVDVSNYLEKKVEALKAHESQLGDRDFTDRVRNWSRDTAALARHKSYPESDTMELAEAFKLIRLWR